MSVLFGILMNFFVDVFTKIYMHAAFKIAITLAFITMVIAAIWAYLAAAKLIINGISQTVPEIVVNVWGWVMPDNTSLCLTAIFSAYILRFTTNQYRLLMNYKFRASISN